MISLTKNHLIYFQRFINTTFCKHMFASSGVKCGQWSHFILSTSSLLRGICNTTDLEGQLIVNKNVHRTVVLEKFLLYALSNSVPSFTIYQIFALHHTILFVLSCRHTCFGYQVQLYALVNSVGASYSYILVAVAVILMIRAWFDGLVMITRFESRP